MLSFLETNYSPYSSLTTHTLPWSTDPGTLVLTPVHMLKAVQIPAHIGIIVEGRVHSYAPTNTLIMFNPDKQLFQDDSITALVQQPINDHVRLFVKNVSSQCQEF